MTTIAAGTSTSITLAAGLAIYATGAYGTMQIAPPNAGPLVQITPAGATIGPLANAVTVNITATGSGISYTLDKDSQPDPLYAAYDPLTGGNNIVGPLSTLKLAAGVTDLTGGVGGVLQRFKTALVAAQGGNMVSNQPLIAPSAWAISTAYVQGQAVSNGGSNYVCITAGTSAGSGGPLTTGADLITDNTVKWWHAGPAFTTSATAPTLSPVTATPFTGTYYSPTGGGYNVGNVKVRDSANFLVTGGTLNPSAGWGNFAQTYPTGPVPNGNIMTVEFMCDAKQLQVQIDQVAQQGVTIYVDQNDGAGMRALTLGTSGVNSGAAVNFYPIAWTTAKPRHYRVEIGAQIASSGFMGVLLTENVSQVWAPANSNRYRAMFVGDSWFHLSATYPAAPSLLIPSQIAKMMGCTDYVIDAYSGTGYVNPGPTSIFGSTQRIAFLAAMAPDIVVIEGGANDTISLSGQQAAILAYLQAARAAVPNAIIFVSGYNNNSGPNASAFTMDLAALNAVTAMNDSKIFFYPFASTVASKAFINGSGTTAAPTGTGSADWYIAGDGHPSFQGAAYVAMRTINAIRSIVNKSL